MEVGAKAPKEKSATSTHQVGRRFLGALPEVAEISRLGGIINRIRRLGVLRRPPTHSQKNIRQETQRCPTTTCSTTARFQPSISHNN